MALYVIVGARTTSTFRVSAYAASRQAAMLVATFCLAFVLRHMLIPSCSRRLAIWYVQSAFVSVLLLYLTTLRWKHRFFWRHHFQCDIIFAGLLVMT